MWMAYDPNPTGRRVGDCAVRAVACACEQSWEDAYIGLCLQGYEMGDMPSSNRVWGAYLKKHGFSRRLIDADCAECYTVEDFCREYPNGVYVLAISGHTVAVRDGCYMDTWDSGDEVPIFYWYKKEA